LFDTFEEFNPDESYGGNHARVCRALANFGPAAAPAVPRLLAELRRSRQTDPNTAAADLVGALGAIGPAAAEALPELQRLARDRDDDGDDSPGNVHAAIRRIRGG
jgi:hypothetical protein